MSAGTGDFTGSSGFTSVAVAVAMLLLLLLLLPRPPMLLLLPARCVVQAVAGQH
jgi:hypothetical protein